MRQEKNSLIGQKINSLTVIALSEKRASNGGYIYICKCDCGNECLVEKSNLKRNSQKTCGKCFTGENIIGNKYNRLTVLERTEEKTGDSYIYKCICDCGEITYVNSRNLRNNIVKSCGCLRGKKKLEIGANYNGILILKNINTKARNGSKYLCKCSCGQEFIEDANLILKGIRKSCGNCNNALQGEIINNWKILERTEQKRRSYNLYKVKCEKCGNEVLKTLSEIKSSKSDFCSNCRLNNDIIGKSYGYYIVLSQEYIKEKRRTYCSCLCKCGSVKTVEKSNLISGNSLSCGCMRESKGEFLISSILDTLNIKYEKQKIFDDCIFPWSGLKAKFDFYLSEKNTVIEYDGQQHYKEVEIFEDNLELIKKRDEYKNLWCKANGIKIIRIPYYDYKIINEEYINKLL